MYAVVACLDCKKKRVVDLNDRSSACPYCGARSEHNILQKFFKSEDIGLVRAAHRQMTGFSGTEEKKRMSPDIDPYSSLEYRYEHCRSLEDKMLCLSEGLTQIHGEFTFEDLEKLEPKNAEKMLRTMLTEGYVHETKYGRYTA